MTTVDTKEIVERASFDAYTTGDLTVLDELVAENIVIHDPFEEVRGRDELKQYISALREAFPDLEATVHSIIAEGDLVSVRFTVSGTHEGPIPGLEDLEPSGERFEIDGIEHDRVEDGELVETWLAFDTLEMMDQLGAIPSPEIAQ